MDKRDEIKGLEKGDEIFCSYKDDNDVLRSGFFVLVNISDSLIEIKSNQNLLVLPIGRVLKIKRKAS